MVAMEEKENEPPVAEEPPTTPATEMAIPDGWKELMGKDLLMKTLQPAAADTEAASVGINHTDVVLVDFVGRAAATPNDTDGPVFMEAKAWWVVVGDKDVLPCLEMGIRFAHVGETVAVWSRSKFAYGTGTRKHDEYELPSNASVLYQVTVKQMATLTEQTQNPLQWVLTTCESKKTIANDAYSNEWSKDGVGKSRIQYLYEKAAKEVAHFLDTYQPPEEKTEPLQQQLEQAQNLLVDCLNNVVAVHLRAKEYHKAKEAAVRVLQRDPNNFKALIRAAKAALLDPASSYEEVEAALSAAAEKADGVQADDLEQLRFDFKRRKQVYEQKSKQMYSKALGGGSKKDTTTSSSHQEETKEMEDTKEEEETAAVPVYPPSASDPKEPKPFSWGDRSTWPWSSILAYAFQLVLPFVMWQVAQYMREEQRRNNPDAFDPFNPRPTAVSSDDTPDADQEF